MGNLVFRVGLVTGSEISTNREGEDNVRLLQVEVTDQDDVQTVEQIRGSGDNQNPQDDSAVIVADLGPAWKVALGVDDGVDPESIQKGERKIYAYDADRIIKSFIHWLVDGTIHINGDADTAVRYSELETAFNQLKSDFDTLVSTYNAHIHITTATVGATPTPGVIAPTTSTGTPSTADITPAEVEDVKLTGYTP